MKSKTVEEIAIRYYHRVQYRKRIESLIKRCKCSRCEPADYDEWGQITYPGAPSCAHMFKADMEEEREGRYLNVNSYLNPVSQSQKQISKVWQDWIDGHRESRVTTWCVRCDRRRALKVARHKALSAEAATKRALMNAVQKGL